MLKVWRGKQGKLFAECTTCGSYGTAGHLKPKVQMAPEIEAALERHTTHMLTLREHFKKAANNIVMQIHNGSMDRRDGAAKIEKLRVSHLSQVHLAQTLLPDPDGKVKELATNCPWCDTAEEVEVATLPEDKDEPDFEQAKAVADYIKKNMKKRA